MEKIIDILNDIFIEMSGEALENDNDERFYAIIDVFNNISNAISNEA